MRCPAVNTHSIDMSSLDAAYAKWDNLNLDTASEDDEPPINMAIKSSQKSE